MNGTPSRSTLERVAAEFALDAPADAIEPFGTGLINDTFLVTTRTGGEYVLQRINRSVFGDPTSLMRNVAIVSAHLGGRFVPDLVPSRGGGWIVADADETWRAWRRIADARTIHHLTPARVASAGQLLGRFHAALADLAPSMLTETIPSFHNPSHRLALLRSAVAADPVGRASGVAAEIETAFAYASLAALADDLQLRVPARVAHNDAQLANILFRGEAAVCLVDLDTVMPTAWFWDVGDLLRTASTSAAEDDPDPERQVADPALVHAILDGYRAGAASAVAPGTAEDDALTAAGLLITYEQALRFLTDWILGDVYYRTTRTRQNLDRARAQLALLTSLQATVAL
jgi:Ser/Thr protein kinase RdoA (MazF antagonist)